MIAHFVVIATRRCLLGNPCRRDYSRQSSRTPVSEFLDGLARSLAQPMPRRRALRVLGGAVASVAISGAGAVPRSAWASAAADPCTCSPGPPAARCGEPLGAGCTKLCCVQGSTLPKCCRWIGTNRVFPASSNYSCANHQGGTFGTPPNQVVSPARTLCCCPANTFCPADVAVAQQPCIPCTASGEERCGGNCCKRGDHCASASISLCCRNGEIRCGQKCCPSGICAKKTGVCCEPGQKVGCRGTKCCYPTQICSGGKCRCATGWAKCGDELCCNKRTEVCSPFRGLRKTPYCCPKPRWMASASRCCPPGTVGINGVLPACCPPGDPDCCAGVNCALKGTWCVRGTCHRM